MSENKFRTVDIVLDGDFAGQTAKMRAEGISARIFIELSSSSVEKQMAALAKLIVEHTLCDAEGTPVADALDAPIDALAQLASKWGEAVAALPPR